MIGLLTAHPALSIATIVPTLFGLAFLVYMTIKYGPIIGEKFEEPPLFMPPRVNPAERGEEVEFSTEDGVKLSGSYLRARTEERAGVIRLLPRVPQRPMELPALHRSSSRSGI